MAVDTCWGPYEKEVLREPRAYRNRYNDDGGNNREPTGECRSVQHRRRRGSCIREQSRAPFPVDSEEAGWKCSQGRPLPMSKWAHLAGDVLIDPSRWEVPRCLHNEVIEAQSISRHGWRDVPRWPNTQDAGWAVQKFAGRPVRVLPRRLNAFHDSIRRALHTHRQLAPVFRGGLLLDTEESVCQLMIAGSLNIGSLR